MNKEEMKIKIEKSLKYLRLAGSYLNKGYAELEDLINYGLCFKELEELEDVDRLLNDTFIRITLILMKENEEELNDFLNNYLPRI